MNMKIGTELRKLSRLLKTLGQPVRLQILQAIGEGEVCVCHLEASLGYRQALISQHLMALRKVRLLTARREGRYIFYRLRSPALRELIRLAGEIAGVEDPGLSLTLQAALAGNCICPHCSPPAAAT